MITDNNKAKISGVLMLVFLFPVLFIVGWLILLGSISTVEYGMDLEVIVYSVLCLLFFIFAIFIPIKYIINKPFKQNGFLGKSLLTIGIIFLLYGFFVHVVFFKYLLDHGFFSEPGKVGSAYYSPIIFFSIGLYLILFGINMNYFGKTSIDKKY